MQIVADALLLAVTDFEYLTFQLPPRSGVLQHRQPETIAAQHQRGDDGLHEQHIVAIIRAAYGELAHQRSARTGGDLIGGFGNTPVERRMAGHLIEVFADQRAGDDSKHAIEGRVGHADDAAAVRQHDALVHDFDRQRLAAQHFFVGLAVSDVVHDADEAVDLAIGVEQRLVGEVDPTRLAAQSLQRQLRDGAFTAAYSLAPV